MKQGEVRMKEAFEKIIERLEDTKGIVFLTLANTGDKTRDIVYDEVMVYLNTAIEIVNQVAEEYATDINVGNKDGWIPCSERLPKVPEGIEDSECPEFNVTIKGAKLATTLKYAPDGTWFDDDGEIYRVIAWMPLPELYKGE